MPSDTTFGHVKVFDDFLGDTFDTFLWTVNADTGGTSEIAEAANGIIRLASDGTNGDINNLFGAELFTVSNNGPLVMEARIKVSSLTTGFFVGLSDDNDADEVPIDIDGGTLTTTATNAAGFAFDSQETAGTLYMVSVNADVDGAQTAVTSPLVVAATYVTLRVVVNPDGDVLYFVNGKEKGSRTAAVATTAVLCPAIAQITSGTACNLDVDYVYVCAPRQ